MKLVSARAAFSIGTDRPAIQVVAYRDRIGQSGEWDEFAQECGASFRCARSALRFLQTEHHLWFQVRRLELHLQEFGERRKIGQCAIGVGRHRRVFADGLQLKPGYEMLWQPAMTAVLAALGPGRYRYGSHWSLETPRERELGSLDGIRLERIRPHIVQAVDFGRWSSWEEYFQQISANVRRNARRALDNPGLHMRVREGLAGLREMPALLAMQKRLADRKKVPLASRQRQLRLALRTGLLRDHAVTATARSGADCLATYSGVEFGGNSYYLNGASTPDNGGAAWHLLLAMLRRAWDRGPGPRKFVMGTVQAPDDGWEKLDRSRQQCRVSAFPTSVVDFAYRPRA